MDTERKISTLHEKKLENDSKGEGKMPGNGKRKPKKTGFSFEKNSGKVLKTREWDEKISQHWTKNIPMKQKISKTDDPDERVTELFLPADNKNAGKEAGRNPKIYQAYPENA